MTEHLYAAIMAGGGGTRLWPLSRKGKPKQALKIFGEQSLFQMAIHRLDGLIPMERIFVLTIRAQAELLKKHVAALQDENFILEPAPRGTASAIGLAAIMLRRNDPDAVMACLTADHYIPGVDAFQSLLKAGYEIAASQKLVTLGITPAGPDTGYGYIKCGDSFGTKDRLSGYHVEAFTEKPDHETALRYVESGEYLWNSGMFIWHVDAILQEIERQLPDLHACLKQIEGQPADTPIDEAMWNSLENITVDYGVMEAADQVAVLPADGLGWVDVGDWGRLFDVLPHDDLHNVVVAAQAELLDTNGVLIFQESESSSRLIAGLGLSDLVIIDTGDVLFACSKSRAAELKRLIQRLQDNGLDRYL